MGDGLLPLYVTAVTIGFFHTVFGPDHYIPFIAMKKAKNWSLIRTAVLTVLCGIGHVLSSVLLGATGIVFGIAVLNLESIESVRGDLAGWAFIAFGLVYTVWGLRRALKNRAHSHTHFHEETGTHSHEHSHLEDHVHAHEEKNKTSITPWVLFTVFFLGPCEPLIPILMYPAAQNSIAGVVGVTLLFGTVTVSTMLGMVMALSLGVNVLPLKRVERYSHALAGLTIFICGVMIQAGL